MIDRGHDRQGYGVLHWCVQTAAVQFNAKNLRGLDSTQYCIFRGVISRKILVLPKVNDIFLR